MVFILLGIFLVVAGAIALWKGPVSRSAKSLQDDGSSQTEAYIIIFLLAAALVLAVYFLAGV
jgi:hypothetical protein